MNKKKFTLVGIVILLIFTSVVAFAHINSRVNTSAGMLRIEIDNQVNLLSVDQLELVDIDGVLSNAKGESLVVDTQGIRLHDILTQTGTASYSQVTVIAADEYSAEVSSKEVNADDQVYVALQNDGGLQLIVFGDSNSKRNVTNLSRIIVK